MIIERLGYNDLEEYKNLINECFDACETTERFEREYNINDNNLIVLVLKVNNEIVSSITYLKVNLFAFSMQPSIMLFNVLTNPKYRGQGYGKLLFNYIYENAKKEGYKQITLTCLEDELGVHKFYESCGMTKANSRKYYMDIN